MRRTLTGTLVFLIAASYLLQITVVGYEDELLLNRFYVENGEYYRLITVALLLLVAFASLLKSPTAVTKIGYC